MQSTIKVSVIHTMLPSNSRPCSFRKTLASSMEVILDSTGSSFSAIFFGHGGPTLLPPFPTRDESRVPSGLPFNFVLDILLFGNDVCVISQKRTEDIATTICYCKQSLHPPKFIWGPTRCHMVTNQESSLLVHSLYKKNLAGRRAPRLHSSNVLVSHNTAPHLDSEDSSIVSVFCEVEDVMTCHPTGSHSDQM